MPVLIIAVVFFLMFLVMGIMGFTATAAEQKEHLFSGHRADQPKPVEATSKP